MRRDGPRPLSFYLLAAFFALFVLFLYGPTLTILVLSFQGPQGGLTFPLNGVSTHWFSRLWAGLGVVDIWAAFRRSFALGLVVMVLTVTLAFFAGLAFRSRFVGSGLIFYLAVASLIVPSILISLGIGLLYRVMGWDPAWYSSAFGAHLTWTLPFGLLIMFAVFNRFDRAYEEAARDLGADGPRTLIHVVVPIILPSLVGVALFGFTLSWDELARTSQAIGGRNTLPLELQGLTTTVTTPEIYALGTVTTGVSLVVIALSFSAFLWLQKRRARRTLLPGA